MRTAQNLLRSRHPSGRSVGLKVTLRYFPPLVDGKDLKGASQALNFRPGGRVDSWNQPVAMGNRFKGSFRCTLSPVSAAANGANQFIYSLHLCRKDLSMAAGPRQQKETPSKLKGHRLKGNKRPGRANGATCYHHSQNGVATFPLSRLPNANWK